MLSTKPLRDYSRVRKDPERAIKEQQEISEKAAAKMRQIFPVGERLVLPKSMEPEMLTVDVEPSDILEAPNINNKQLKNLKPTSKVKTTSKCDEKSEELTETSTEKSVKYASLRWGSHDRHLLNGLWTYFKQNFETDFELCATNNQGRDHIVKVHHLVLSIFCPTLKDIPEKKMKLDISEEDLRILVEFLYVGRINLPYDRLMSVKKAARELGFNMLFDMIGKCLDVREGLARKKTGEALITIMKPPKETQQTVEDGDDACGADLLVDHHAIPVSNPSLSTNPKILKVKKFKCNVCGKRFVKLATLLTHARVHLKADKVQCQLCPFKALNEIGLRIHLGVKHENMVRSNIFSCSQCSYVCRKNLYLKRHLVNAHGAKNFLCEMCPYVCRTQKQLKSHHKMIHTKERAFMCDTCGYRGKTLARMKIHKLKHEERVKCDVCGRELAQSAIKRHYKVHSDDTKKFTCHLCSFATRDRYNLRVHLRNVHSLTVSEVQSCILSNFPYCSLVREDRALAMSTFHVVSNQT